MKRVGMGVVCALFLLSGCAHMGKPGEYFQRLLAFCHLGSPPQEKKPEVCILDPASYVPEASPETASREKPPVVEVPVTAHDFGRLSESEDYVHKFSVRNAGKSVLSIKKVVPG